MLFVVEILGEPDSQGKARVLERTTHTGPTVTEALRTAQANLRATPRNAYSFSMKANGREVGRWRRDSNDILGDIESARSGSRAADDDGEA